MRVAPPRPPSLDDWIAGAIEQLGCTAHPALVASLLFEKIEALETRAPKAREMLIRSALMRAVKGGVGRP